MGILENLIGSVKDTASLSKATLLSPPTSLPLRLAILRATSHHPSSSPSRHLPSLLSLANSSPRSSASSALSSLLSRLHSTRSSPVALKCLLLLHSFIRLGSFILHDQLSLLHNHPHRHHLILSSFLDPDHLPLSSFIRWYARYLEQLLSTSRALRFFLFSLSCRHLERKTATENLPLLSNSELLRGIHALVDVLDEIGRYSYDPESVSYVSGEGLVAEVVSLVAEDYGTAVEELESRVAEFGGRMTSVSFADSVEMFCAIKRLDDCRERLLEVPVVTGGNKEAALWKMTGRVREGLVAVSEKVEKMAVVSWRRVGQTGGSERFGERVVDAGVGGKSFRFSSNRFTFQS